MSVNLLGLSARPVHDNKPDIQGKTLERVELGARLCEFSARVCEFSGGAIEDVRRTRLYQKARLKLQQDKLTALRHKLSAQRDKFRKLEPALFARVTPPHSFRMRAP